jgi:hypothetical protein
MTVMMANRAQILLRPNDRRDEEFGMVQMTFPTYGPMKSPDGLRIRPAFCASAASKDQSMTILAFVKSMEMQE